MDNLAASYLAQFGELPLQGLGRIYIKRESAILDFANQQLLPPKNRFLFEPDEFVNIDVFISYVARMEQTDEATASEKVKTWSVRLLTDISEKKELFIPFAGRWRVEDDGQLSADSEESLQIFKSITLKQLMPVQPAASVETVDEETSSEAVPEEGGEPEEEVATGEKKSDKSWWIAALIIFLLSVSIILFSMFTGDTGDRVSPREAPRTYITK